MVSVAAGGRTIRVAWTTATVQASDWQRGTRRQVSTALRRALPVTVSGCGAAAFFPCERSDAALRINKVNASEGQERFQYFIQKESTKKASFFVCVKVTVGL